MPGFLDSLKSAMSFRNSTADSAASSSAAPNSAIAPQSNPNPQQPATSAPAASSAQASPSPSVSGNMSTSGSRQNSSITGPAASLDMFKFSASTEEILKRVVGANAARVGTPGYEAARESVLKSMVTSDKITTAPQPAASGRRRGGARGGRASAGSPLANGESIMNGSSTPTTSTPNSSRGRGRGSGRGRGRGGGRGGKRKREDSEESDGDSDESENYTPAQTQTKSGRQITKPTTFVPTLPSPSVGTKRKRPTNKKPEVVLCKVCSRATSTPGNLIVFCDGCNTSYHQYCHDPPIGKEVVQVVEKEWFCSQCIKNKVETAKTGLPATIVPPVQVPTSQPLVAHPDLSPEEVRRYFSTLQPYELINLLASAVSIHPSLPIFQPNARSKLAQTPNSASLNAAIVRQQTNSTTSAQSFPKPFQPSTTAPDSSSTSLSSPPTSTASLSSALAAAGGPSSTSEAPTSAPAPEQDPHGYDEDYDMGHYPKPGNGLARTLRPESEDLQWLVDDNFEVFSHQTYEAGDSGGVNGFE